MVTKCILNIRIADELVKRGFRIISVKPSSKIRGRAVFAFEDTKEFQEAFEEITQR